MGRLNPFFKIYFILLFLMFSILFFIGINADAAYIDEVFVNNPVSSPVPVFVINQASGTTVVSGVVSVQEVNPVSQVTILNFPVSQTVNQGTLPWIVSGSVTTGITFPSSFVVNQGTSPWIVSGSVAVLNPVSQVTVLNFPTSQTVNQGTTPWIVSGTLGRNWFLDAATDSVSVSGVATSANQLLQLSQLGIINTSIVSNTASTSASISTNTTAVISGTNGIIAAINATSQTALLTQIASNTLTTASNTATINNKITTSGTRITVSALIENPTSSIVSVSGPITVSGVSTAANQVIQTTALSSILSNQTDGDQVTHLLAPGGLEADFSAGATSGRTLRVEANQGAANNASQAWPTKITDDAGGNVVDVQSGSSAGQPVGDIGLVVNARNYLFDGSLWSVARDSTVGNNVTGDGIGPNYGQYNSTLPTITSGRYTSLQTDINGKLLVSGGVTVLNQNLSTSSTLISSGGTPLNTGEGNTTSSTLRVTVANDETLNVSGTIGVSESVHTRINTRRFLDSEEVRMDIPADLTSGNIYIGIASAGAVTSGSVWSVVKTSFGASSTPTRGVFKSGVIWDNRTSTTFP